MMWLCRLAVTSIIAVLWLALDGGKIGKALTSRRHFHEGLQTLAERSDSVVDLEPRGKLLCHPVDNGSSTGELYQKFLPTINAPDKNIPVIQQLISNATWRDPGPWPRNLAIFDFLQWIANYHLQSPKRLVAFSDDPENSLVAPEQRMDFFYKPSTGENDIHSMAALKTISDFAPTMALLGNVFPTLHDPQLAMSNVFDVLEDGGFVFLCAPLTGVSDNMPFHFYHSTWIGLVMLMERAGFETLEMRQWGSYYYEAEIAKLNSQPKSVDLKMLQQIPGRADFAWGLFRKSTAKYKNSCSDDVPAAQARWLMHKSFTAKDIVHLWGVVEPSMSRRPKLTSDVYNEELLSKKLYSNKYDMGRAVTMLHYKQILRQYAAEIKENPQLLGFGGPEHEHRLGPKPFRGVDFGAYRPASGRLPFAGDLHKLSLENIASKLAKNTSGVDFCILGQTLEHLYDPFLAVQNLFDVTAPCGFLFTSTPFANIPHMTPSHYYHYTIMGLAMLFARAGFNVLEMGQWGSEEYLELLFKTMKWPGFSSLHNQLDGDAIAQVWVFFQRPCSA